MSDVEDEELSQLPESDSEDELRGPTPQPSISEYVRSPDGSHRPASFFCDKCDVSQSSQLSLSSHRRLHYTRRCLLCCKDLALHRFVAHKRLGRCTKLANIGLRTRFNPDASVIINIDQLSIGSQSLTEDHFQSEESPMDTTETEGQTRLHQCRFCSHKSKRKYDLKIHENRHMARAANESRMSVAEYQTRTEDPLQSDLGQMDVTETLDDQDPTVFHQCRFCPHKTKRKSDLQKHENKKHLDRNESSISVTESPIVNGWEAQESLPGHTHSCQLCSYVATNRSSLQMHNSTVHRPLQADQGIDLHTCGDCKGTYKTRESLLKHRRRFHSSSDQPQISRTFECQCRRAFKRLSDLSRHSKRCQPVSSSGVQTEQSPIPPDPTQPSWLTQIIGPLPGLPPAAKPPAEERRPPEKRGRLVKGQKIVQYECLREGCGFKTPKKEILFRHVLRDPCNALLQFI